MPQEKIIIKFVADGDKDLIQALNNLKKAQDRVNSATKSVTTTTNANTTASGKATTASGALTAGHHRLAATNGKLAMSFATLRSKMLLVTFAMSMGGRQAVQMVKDFAKVEAMSVAFDTLSGGAGNASIALSQLSNAVGGTMSRMDLLQTANNALILGVAKSSKEMSVMFGVAVKLGRAVGRTAKDSVDSLVTGIGRQSRLMLDNIGIIMDTEKAYASYASELGVTVESLNETERRQAFLNATLEAAKEKADLLGDSIETLQSKAERAGSSWDNLQVAAGGFISTMFDVDTGLDKTADVFDILTFAMDENLKIAKTWGSGMVKTFETMLNSIPVVQALGIIIGEVTDRYKEQADAVALLGGDEDILFKVKQASGEQEIKMRKLVSETTNAKLRSLDALIDEVKEGKRFFLTTKDQLDVLAMLEKQYDDLNPAEKERIENLKALTKQQKELERWQKEQSKGFRQAEEEIRRMFPSYIEYRNQITLQLEAEENLQENMAKTIAWLDKMGIAHDLETDAMRKSREEREKAIEVSEELAQSYREEIVAQLQARDAHVDAVNERIGVENEFQDAIRKRREESIKARKEKDPRAPEKPPEFIDFRVAPIQEALDIQFSLITEDAARRKDLERRVLAERMLLVQSGQMTEIEAREHYNERMKELIAALAEEEKKAADEKAISFSEGLSMSLSAIGAMTSAQSEQLNAEMRNMKAGDNYKNASREKQKQLEDNMLKSQAKERTKIAEKEKLAKIASATMNTYEAVSRAWAQTGVFGAVSGAIALMAGLAQVQAIMNTPIPKFATGGMIGGRRHSQGGTMIEAEQGEFVMSRNAVDSVGIENLNRMNEGGGGGSVTVNVSGNVMSQDYVEGELAEQIKESIRRGTDFGIG